VPLVQAAQNVVPVAVTAGDKLESRWLDSRQARFRRRSIE
jgi:hypothetical protein